ncbi:hypothetical protein BH10PSE7_BH10PSE7_41560 [soil metagenome]
MPTPKPVEPSRPKPVETASWWSRIWRELKNPPSDDEQTNGVGWY